MKDFKEYISEQDEKELDEELLLEDPATVIITILALPTLVALGAWGASVVAAGYYRVMSGIIDRIVTTWRRVFSDAKGKIDKNRVKANVRQMALNPKAREQARQMKEDKRKFEEELGNVYSAIEDRDFNAAKAEFDKVDKNIRNNPDAHKVIIVEITKALKEPPLYVTSPGNKTYQAIKRVINIRVARAAAMASKMAIEKALNDDEIRSMERENEEE